MTIPPSSTRPYRFLPDQRRLLTGDELEAARQSAPIPDEALPVICVEWTEAAQWNGIIYGSEILEPAHTAPMARIDEHRWLLVWRLAVQRAGGTGPLFEQIMTAYGPRVSVGADPDSDSPQDVAAVYQAGLRLTGIYLGSPRGRRRLDDTSTQLDIARDAVKVKEANPTWTWPRIAWHIGLVSAIEDEGKSKNPEQAAKKNLQRWRRALQQAPREL